MNTGFMGNNREFLSNRGFFCDLGEMPQHSFMTTFYPQLIKEFSYCRLLFASSPIQHNPDTFFCYPFLPLIFMPLILS